MEKCEQRATFTTLQTCSIPICSCSTTDDLLVQYMEYFECDQEYNDGRDGVYSMSKEGDVCAVEVNECNSEWKKRAGRCPRRPLNNRKQQAACNSSPSLEVEQN